MAQATLLNHVKTLEKTLENEYEIWVLYSSLHFLNLGGVPEIGDMKTFAPHLWRDQTKSPAVYFVWNDHDVSPNEYIKKETSLGHYEIVDERVQESPHESVASMEEENVVMERAACKAELWAAAENKWQLFEQKRESFDTGGLSVHGVIPRHCPDGGIWKQPMAAGARTNPNLH